MTWLVITAHPPWSEWNYCCCLGHDPATPNWGRPEIQSSSHNTQASVSRERPLPTDNHFWISEHAHTRGGVVFDESIYRLCILPQSKGDWLVRERDGSQRRGCGGSYCFAESWLSKEVRGHIGVFQGGVNWCESTACWSRVNGSVVCDGVRLWGWWVCGGVRVVRVS